MAGKVVIPKGTIVLTCGHAPLERMLVDPNKSEEDTVLLCQACFAEFLTEGELSIDAAQFELEEDILDMGSGKWS